MAGSRMRRFSPTQPPSEAGNGLFVPALSQIADSALVALRLEGKK
jgi:hypothetical protein